MTAATSDWPDLQFGVEEMETMLSRTTNGLIMQCTRAINYHRTINLRCGSQAIEEIPMEMFTPTHALHNDRRRLVKNMEHFALDNDILACHNSTVSGEVCTHDSLWKDKLSTMTGGGRLSIDIGIESPKHRDSLGLHMNYYVHGNRYTQYAHPQLSHEWKTICTLK